MLRPDLRMDRRQFVQLAAMTGGAAAISRAGTILASDTPGPWPGRKVQPCLFTKPTVPIDSPAEEANWESIRRDWRTMPDLLKHAELV